jgi:hypothetical protein
MSAVIVGSPSSGSKVLRRADFSTERNGLETLNEIYTVRTADRRTLQPNFGTLHSAYSTASTKFARMAVENFSFREQDGDLTEINVTYVGLTSATGLPPALVRLIPTPGAGVYGPPMVIEAEFLTDKTEAEFIATGAGGLVSPNYGRILMPSTINGKLMPSNPREPFKRATYATSFAYFGYTQSSISCEKRGFLLVARAIYAEEKSFTYSIAGPFSTGRGAAT